MRRLIFWLAMLFLSGMAPVTIAQYAGTPLKLLFDRQSTVDPVGILKYLGQKCPNVTLTTNAEQSDYMLSARGWSGNYRFMISAKGGEKIFATQTVYLSNAVKDVCHFLNNRPRLHPHAQPNLDSPPGFVDEELAARNALAPSIEILKRKRSEDLKKRG